MFDHNFHSKYGPFDPDLDDYDVTPDDEGPRCKRCGATDVRWRQQGGKWVLFSLEPGKLHVCPIVDNFQPVKE